MVSISRERGLDVKITLDEDEVVQACVEYLERRGLKLADNDSTLVDTDGDTLDSLFFTGFVKVPDIRTELSVREKLNSINLPQSAEEAPAATLPVMIRTSP
jgi:hypothetical protein